MTRKKPPSEEFYKTFADDYQMISIPFNSNEQTLAELFNELCDYDNTKFRIYDWDWIKEVDEEGFAHLERHADVEWMKNGFQIIVEAQKVQSDGQGSAPGCTKKGGGAYE